MIFQWDANKNNINQKKHGVSFKVAELIFNDPYIISVLDNRFDYPQERWYSIGSAAGMVLLFVAHVTEESENGEEIIRIISARKAEKSESERYLRNHG